MLNGPCNTLPIGGSSSKEVLTPYESRNLTTQLTIVRMYLCTVEDVGVLLQNEVHEKRGKGGGVDREKASKIRHCNESIGVPLETKVT